MPARIEKTKASATVVVDCLPVAKSVTAWVPNRPTPIITPNKSFLAKAEWTVQCNALLRM